MPAAAPDESVAAPTLDTPGQLACRTSRENGTTELFLDWQGPKARGILRRVAPSGNLTEMTVHAEHYKNMIVADDIWETDLAAHAALVAPHKGKLYMRLGDWSQPWTVCE